MAAAKSDAKAQKTSKLSPEAFGTLLAMKRISKIRFFDEDVAKELTSTGLAELKGKELTITAAGKDARKIAKSVQRKSVKKNAAA
jgi:hypothetical protein